MYWKIKGVSASSCVGKTCTWQIIWIQLFNILVWNFKLYSNLLFWEALKEDNGKIYIQVAYRIHKNNINREFENLLEIPDNYKKMVVSVDPYMGNTTYRGIEQAHIRDFLLRDL